MAILGCIGKGHGAPRLPIDSSSMQTCSGRTDRLAEHAREADV